MTQLGVTVLSLVAAFVAVILEWSYRTLPAPWHNVWHLIAFVAFQTFIGVCVYKIVTAPGTSLIGAFIVWSSAVIALRIVVSLTILKEPVSAGTWAALVLLIIARILQHYWK